MKHGTWNMKQETFHSKLQSKMDDYVHGIYALTKSFPKEELYGVTSQLRRSALSVILNYIEGYARGRDKVHKNFLEISYGSLKESMYLIEFSCKEGYVDVLKYKELHSLGNEIGAMIWGILRKI